MKWCCGCSPLRGGEEVCEYCRCQSVGVFVRTVCVELVEDNKKLLLKVNTKGH